MTTLIQARSSMLAMLPAELRAEATRRLDVHMGILAGRLFRLYGERPDFEGWLARLLESMGQCYAARPADLRILDANRSANPGWFKGSRMLGYSAYVDNFSGSLRGIVERIPHLQELGVTYLHLLPFLAARQGENDGGFAVSNYDEVEPAYGTNADLEYLTRQLRAAGISLCSDLILNHVADDHAWAIAARRGDAAKRNYFYVYPDRSLPDMYEKTVQQVFPQAAPGNFTYDEALGGWVWTTFYPYQWDLNYANPEVFSEMVLTLLRMANRGIEAFRMDSAAFLWKRPGTNCMNQPETHWILQAFRSIVDIVAPGALLKAEAIVPTRELPPYFGLDSADQPTPECHLAYHSSLMAAAWASMAEQNKEILGKVIEATPALPESGAWVTYVRCHDDIGWNVLRPEALIPDEPVEERLERISLFFAGEAISSYADGVAFQTHDGNAVHGTNGMAAALVGFSRAEHESELLLAERRLALLYGLVLIFGGMPIIYMGDELAQGNDNSADRSQLLRRDSRWLQRPRFDQVRYEQRYDSRTVGGRFFMTLCRMVQTRKMLAELDASATVSLMDSGSSSVLALERGQSFVYLANFCSETRLVDWRQMMAGENPGDWSDLLAAAGVADVIELAPWQSLWLHRSSK